MNALLLACLLTVNFGFAFAGRCLGIVRAEAVPRLAFDLTGLFVLVCIAERLGDLLRAVRASSALGSMLGPKARGR